MVDLALIKKNRFLFLSKLYDYSIADTRTVFKMFEVGAELGFDYDLTKKVVTYLVDEGLLEYFGTGGTIQLTHQGLKEMEEAYEHPEKPTKHFPPTVTYNNNITITSTGSGSLINTGNENTFTITNNFKSSKIIEKANQIIEAVERDETLTDDVRKNAVLTLNDLITEVKEGRTSSTTLDKILFYGASIASIGSLVVGILQLIHAPA
jgi:hypothetical protein